MTGFVLKMCHSIHNRLEGVVSTAKRGLNIVILLLMGLLTGLVLAEVLVRMAIPSFGHVARLHRVAESERGKFAKYDSVLGWDGLENAQDMFEWVDTRHHVRQNRFGYRGSEYDYQRSDYDLHGFLGQCRSNQVWLSQAVLSIGSLGRRQAVQCSGALEGGQLA